MVDSTKFKALVKEHFVPILRNQGFSGSGLSFRKDTGNHYIHSLKIQANRHGGSCCVEMGVYIDFIPNALNQIVQPSKVTPYDCVLNKRLLPSGGDFRWEYGQNESDATKSIKHLITTFEVNGLQYFSQFLNFPTPLDSITLKDIEKGSPNFYKICAPMGIRIASTIARVQLYLGNNEEAFKISEWGLKNIGRAILLIPEFEDIRQKSKQ